HPARLVRRWQQGRVADGKIHEAAERIGHAADGIPSGGGMGIDAEREPAVPGEILELHRADENRRLKTGERVVADVLDAGGEFDVDVFALDRVAGDDLAAGGGEQGDKLGLQMDALDEEGVITALEGLPIGLNAPVRLARAIGEETRGVKPAGSHPRRREPAIHGEHGGRHQLGRVDFGDLHIPIGVADGPSYAFAYRWGARPEAKNFHPLVAAATAVMRAHLLGVRVVGTDTTSKSFRFGDFEYIRELLVVDVYSSAAPIDPEQDAVISPPWSTLPWHLLVLMEEAVARGWAAFSQSEARRRGVDWLDLVRPDAMKERLAGLVETFEREGYRPGSLTSLVSA